MDTPDPQNTAIVELRTIPVRLVEDDGVTPAAIDTTGLKPQIRRIGTAPGYDELDAALVAVSGVTGEYEVRLTQAEANRETGNYRGLIPATGTAIQMPFTFQILPDIVFQDPATPEELAVATVNQMDNNSTKLDIPTSAMLFPQITDEGARTIVFRDKNGNVVAQGTFGRDNVSRLPFTDIDPDEE